MKLKICGMKYEENILEVAGLEPDYLGFIFYEKSPRNFIGTIPQLPDGIKKVGVFVDASIDFILEKVKQYNFDAIQLHGAESAEYCLALNKELKEVSTPLDLTEGNDKATSRGVEIWKVFSIKDEFDFDRLKPYEGIVDAFLFDTKGKEKGGNGYTFDWSVLMDYPVTTPFILSGGIGVDEVTSLLSFLEKPASKSLYGIDVNSKFEEQPGLKNIEKLQQFKNLLTINQREG